jgi:hypothetical protein
VIRSPHVPVNANGEPADERDWRVALAAGGKTKAELKKSGAKPFDYWLDEHTDLYIPNGVLLFRPWRKSNPVDHDAKSAADLARDHMQLED